MIEDEVVKTGATDEEETSSSSTALVEVNVDDLNKESLQLINQIIAESDVDKTKDLTYLFNINQNKKTMVRMDKLNALQDILVMQLSKRVSERPDEISNQELMQGLKVVQDIIERGQKQIAGVNETPFIQINQQTNSVNVGNPSELNRESRDKVKNAVQGLLDAIATTQHEAEVIDATPVEEVEPIVVEDNEDDD